ncbi:MAG: lipopolysaccharide heptosyltransferase family protein [Spartobacteria bacterium]|nr:lipopolysaccharide heptosyltransferase family protein [Spartobacteria bacterium]
MAEHNPMTSDITGRPPPAIVLVKLSSLGDLFHALPTAALLKKHLQARLDWVTQPEYQALVECFPMVDRVFTYPRRNVFRQYLPFMRELRHSRYDLVIDLQGLFKSAMITAGIRGHKKIGPSYYREGAALFYDEVAGARNKNRHAVEEALDIVRHLGLPVDDVSFPVSFPRRPLETGHPRIALLPRSRWPTKNWPIEHFITLANGLRAQCPNAVFYIVGGPGDQAPCAQMAQGVEGAIDTSGKTSLVELGSLLQEMDLLITVDSGPMHMAAACGTPVLALFGPTDPVRTGPYGNRNRIIQADPTPCRPCRNRTCPACLQAMHNLPPAQVQEQALAMLQRDWSPG